MATLSQFAAYILPDVLGCPLPIVHRELVSAIQDFCEDTWALSTDITYAFTAQDIDPVGFIKISLPIEYAQFRPCAIDGFFLNGQSWELILAQNSNNRPADISAKRKYFLINSDNSISIFPFTTPGTVHIKVILKPLRSAMQFPDQLLEDNLDPIIANARYRLFGMSGKAWTDKPSAMHEFTTYRVEVTKCRKKMLTDLQRKSNRVHYREYGG